MADQLPKAPEEYVSYPDKAAQEAAAAAQENAMLAMQGASQALIDATKNMQQVNNLNNAPTFVNATLQNTMVAETNRPVRYASLIAQTVRFAGATKVGTTAATRTAGTRVFQLQQGYRPTTVKYLPVTVKDLPKGGLKLNVLSILGVSLGVGEGMTTGQTILNVATDGWVTLGSDMLEGSVLVFDSATMLIP